MARGPGRGIESLQNISDRFCQLVFKNRLGFRELEVNFISVRDDASLVFVLITRFSTCLHFLRRMFPDVIRPRYQSEPEFWFFPRSEHR